MKVYTLWHYDYEQTSMQGTWSTLDGALNEFKRSRAANLGLGDHYWRDYGIEVYTLDEPDTTTEQLSALELVDPASYNAIREAERIAYQRERQRAGLTPIG